MKAKINVYKQANNIVAVYVLLIILPGTISCSGLLRNYGMINPSAGVTGDFERFHVKTELRYYISGADLYPNAIMGLREDVRLDPRALWKEVKMTPPQLRELVGDMKAKAFGLGLYLYGFELITPDGGSIGVWYSIPSLFRSGRTRKRSTVGNSQATRRWTRKVVIW